MGVASIKSGASSKQTQRQTNKQTDIGMNERTLLVSDVRDGSVT